MSLDLFSSPDALAILSAAPPQALDDMDVGIIGFRADGIAAVYNRRESRFSGLTPAEVIGRPLFTEVAQCMNNYLVAQRFEDAQAAGTALDATIDFVLTWRMRPTPVRIRLLWAPGAPLRWLLLRHAPPAAGRDPL